MKIQASTCVYRAVLSVLSFTPHGFAQGISLKHGNFITPADLPTVFAAAWQKMGGRMMSADNASVTLSGTITDANGSRPARVTVQSPGYLRFQDNNNSSVLTFDGNQWRGKNTKGGVDDERIEESLLAHLPDTIFLQLAAGGGLRRIGGNFRTDDGTTPNYAGPYWTLHSFSPTARTGIPWGQALQQGIFIAIDENTLLLSETRIVNNSPVGQMTVTQTKLNNWFQQAGQWYPGQIVRLQNGQQVLTFVVQGATTGGQLPNTAFTP